MVARKRGKRAKNDNDGRIIKKEDEEELGREKHSIIDYFLVNGEWKEGV